MMVLTDEFRSEWNRLVRLYAKRGRQAIEKGLKGTVGTQYAAARRLLCRLDAGLNVSELAPPTISAEERETWGFLRRQYPLEPQPLIAEFDGLTLALQTWRTCAAKVRAEGLKEVDTWLTLLENDNNRSSTFLDRRLEDALPKVSPDNFGRTDTEWGPVAVAQEDSIKHIDAEITYRIGVVRQFLGYVHRRNRLYPEDWNYLVAISVIEDESQGEESEESPDALRQILMSPRKRTEWVAKVLSEKGSSWQERFNYLERLCARLKIETPYKDARSLRISESQYLKRLATIRKRRSRFGKR